MIKIFTGQVERQVAGVAFASGSIPDFLLTLFSLVSCSKLVPDRLSDAKIVWYSLTRARMFIFLSEKCLDRNWRIFWILLLYHVLLCYRPQVLYWSKTVSTDVLLWWVSDAKLQLLSSSPFFLVILKLSLFLSSWFIFSWF